MIIFNEKKPLCVLYTCLHRRNDFGKSKKIGILFLLIFSNNICYYIHSIKKKKKIKQIIKVNLFLRMQPNLGFPRRIIVLLLFINGEKK